MSCVPWPGSETKKLSNVSSRGQNGLQSGRAPCTWKRTDTHRLPDGKSRTANVVILFTRTATRLPSQNFRQAQPATCEHSNPLKTPAPAAKEDSFTCSR